MEEADDLAEIRAGLVTSAEALAIELLGDPSSRAGREWRWGRHGSFSMVVRGDKRGLWQDHEAAEGGDALALIRRQRGGSFAEVLDYARGFLGMAPREGHAQPRPRPAAPPPPPPQREDTEDDAARIARARATWAEGLPVAAGDLVDTYLVRTRGIPRPIQGWPATVRYHRRRNALMVAATDAAGAVLAVQLVHLTSDARKRPEAPGLLTKQSFGIVSGNVVRLPGRAGPLLIAEGPETGLSVWAATGRETWVALGSMAKVETPDDLLVILCADDDPREAPAAKTLRRAVGTWRAAGRRVAVVMPWHRRREDKSDFNDAIREAGAAAVAERIERVAQGGSAMPAALPLGLARYRLDRAVAGFFDAARAYDPDLPETMQLPVHAVRAGVGVGKSAVARAYAARELVEMRERGDGRSIVIAVPTHRLGDEQAERFTALPQAQAADLTAAVWRGREAPDPDAPGESMCLDIEPVREAVAHGLDVEASCCRRSVKTSTGERVTFACPFYESCGYQQQKARAKAADVVVVAHEMLFSEKPAAIGNPALVIVDEAPWQAGLEGVEGRPVTLSLDALAIGAQGRDRLDARAASEIYGMVRHALAGQPDGPLRRDAILAAGLDAEIAGDGYSLTWDRLVDPALRPGEAIETRKAALLKAAENRTVIRTARMFRALRALLQDDGPAASGWLHLATEQSDHGPVRVVRLRGRREIKGGWTAPTLLIDATMDPALLRPFWPTLTVTAEIEAEAPHMRVRQLVGRDIGKATLLPDDWRENDPKEIARRRWVNAEIRAIALREARAAGGHLGSYDGRDAGALVVVQKGVEDGWRDAGALPTYLDLAHHNAVAGRDEWRGVRVEIVVGRTLPRAGDAERMAEALTGAAVAMSVQQYDREDAEIILRDGTTVPAEAWRHPDPIAEAVRWQVCEGELVQIIGRARGANRTSADPVEVLILTDRPLPLPVDAVVSWQGLAPSPADMMLAAGGLVLTDAADAAAAYPALWPSKDAARQAFHRARCVTSPLWDTLKGECHAPLRSFPYQRSGAGRRPTVAIHDPAVVANPATWLSERLGELRADPFNGQKRPAEPPHHARTPAPPASREEVRGEPVIPAAALEWLDLLDRPTAGPWVSLPETPALVLVLPVEAPAWPAGDVAALLAMAEGETLIEPEAAPVIALNIEATVAWPAAAGPAALAPGFSNPEKTGLRLFRIVPDAPAPDAVARFRGLAAAFDALPPPPRLWGDPLDLLRLDAWQRRLAAWRVQQTAQARPRPVTIPDSADTGTGDATG